MKAPNVLLALPAAVVRPFIRSFSHSSRAIKITRFAGRNAGGRGRAESEFTVHGSQAERGENHFRFRREIEEEGRANGVRGEPRFVN